MLYMVTFTINIPQMLAYIYIYHTWILCIWPRIQEIEREREGELKELTNYHCIGTKHGEGHARASNKACPPPEKHETCELLICKIQSTGHVETLKFNRFLPPGPGAL